MSIEAGIKDLLKNDTDIWQSVNSRITPLERDESGPLPAIVYRSSEPQQERLLDGSFENIARITISFECWGGTYIAAKILADRAIKVLESFTGEIEIYPGKTVKIMIINAAPVGEDKEFNLPTNLVEFEVNIIYQP
ncbi:hypothetical protein [Arsukibacterium sp.]|uniref:hypothetical protein n=1 Tax=Arsukibacterium sp. TaxID=1977258 RepID=UPI00299F1C09|nr:hypothetical protein [Arsukibacterium sp.]MDX1538828.1 hypothetical protein [Arsukibacterium sp.]